MAWGMQDVAPFNVDRPAVYNDNIFFAMGWYPDGGLDMTTRLVQTNGERNQTVIYTIAQPRSKVFPLPGGDFVFYGSDTIVRINNPFDTFMFRLTPAVLPGGAGVGVTETKNNSTISCYPNPASDRITISSNGIDLRGAILSIVDVAGKSVYSKKIGNDNLSKVNIELPSAIADGFYIVEIQNSFQHISDRLVIHRN
jgi:hypothetical protein